MALSSAYAQHNYMGEYASDADALTFIQGNSWDDAGNGTGNPRNGMWYYNTASGYFRGFRAGAWADFSFAVPSDAFSFQVQSDGLSTTTNVTPNYVDKIAATTVAIPVTGNYEIMYSCAVSGSAANLTKYVRYLVDGSSVRDLQARVSLANLILPMTSNYIVNLSAGNHTVGIKFCISAGTMSIRYANVVVRKVA